MKKYIIPKHNHRQLLSICQKKKKNKKHHTSLMTITKDYICNLPNTRPHMVSSVTIFNQSITNSNLQIEMFHFQLIIPSNISCQHHMLSVVRKVTHVLTCYLFDLTTSILSYRRQLLRYLSKTATLFLPFLLQIRNFGFQTIYRCLMSPFGQILFLYFKKKNAS